MPSRPCLDCGRLVPVAQGSRCRICALRERRPHLRANRGRKSWTQTRVHVLLRDSYRCRWCGGEAHEVDHLTPVARGGSDRPENLVAACRACNARRGARPAT